ncbi:RsfA family transcriptional regulator [Domibacillus indicus]|uniref:RsfA family transcriptional regulator n=1 Tax=Domibacillus indicus TaxID=1437523 RepID=UPI00203EB38E|nr:RsfA family transcriptional regulator [Domibacillus indicus]MCM3788785.1 RsfA family transcriptional regulator [Domibacillus indicus]
MKVRQDAWSEENDLLLAETVLRHVREGSTQLNAFEEVGDLLNRTSAACGFRWNAVVRTQYEKALSLAKKQRKQRSRTIEKKTLYTPPAEGSLAITMADVIGYLQSLDSIDAVKAENERLRVENEQLQCRLNKIEQSSEIMQEDYETLMKIMNRARKFVALDDEEGAAVTFKMEQNGNLEKVAE